MQSEATFSQAVYQHAVTEFPGGGIEARASRQSARGRTGRPSKDGSPDRYLVVVLVVVLVA